MITFHSSICLEKALEFKIQATPTSTVFWLKFYLQSQVEFSMNLTDSDFES